MLPSGSRCLILIHDLEDVLQYLSISGPFLTKNRVILIKVDGNLHQSGRSYLSWFIIFISAYLMFQALTVGFTLILFMMGRSKYEYYFSGIWPVIFVTPILICCRTMSAEAQLAKSRGLPRIICILVSYFCNVAQLSLSLEHWMYDNIIGSIDISILSCQES